MYLIILYHVGIVSENVSPKELEEPFIMMSRLVKLALPFERGFSYCFV